MLQVEDGNYYYGGKEIKPKQTKIVQAEEVKNILIVREDHYKFVGSNIYAINDSHQVVWEAQLPIDDDIFCNKFVIDGNFLCCYTWKGIKCEITISDGGLTETSFEK